MSSSPHGDTLKWAILPSVTAGEGVGDGVKTSRLVLHREIQAKEFVDPLMLRNSGQPLVKQKLETIVISTNCLHQPNQLTFLHSKLKVAGSKWPTEVSKRPDAPVEDSAKPYA